MKSYAPEFGKISIKNAPVLRRPEVSLSRNFNSTISSIYSFCYNRREIDLKGKLTAVALLLAMIGLPWVMMGFI
jgi:hypothetical protein